MNLSSDERAIIQGHHYPVVYSPSEINSFSDGLYAMFDNMVVQGWLKLEHGVNSEGEPVTVFTTTKAGSKALADEDIASRARERIYLYAAIF